MSKEAAFQHHFAIVLRDVGNLFCLKKDDAFFIDLETRFLQNKSIDITCGFITYEKEIKVAIELKFKTKRQGAEDCARMLNP